MISPNDIHATDADGNSLRVSNYALPPLVAGAYQLSASVAVAKIDNNGNDVPFENNSLNFAVTAPQWAMDPGLIYNVYPPQSSVGAYHGTLPHIVFTRKTLPWERVVPDAQPKVPPTPWFALLLITDREVDDKANKITFAEMKTTEIGTGPADLLLPAAARDQFAEVPKVAVIELGLPFFHSIAPTPEDLALLTHVRQVDTSDKANASSNPKGWFSVMMGNRLPQDDTNNTVYLVSLEGHQSAFVLKNDAGKSRIRLVVLHKWSFRSEGNTFAELATQLSRNMQPLALDRHYFSAESIKQQSGKAVQFGYMPVNHDWRTGQTSLSWYRSPLIPVAMPVARLVSYDNADKALRFDTPTGMFDISYAAAWQLGRMLALKNDAFFTALNGWKMNYERARTLGTATQLLKEKADLEPDDLAALIKAATTDEVLLDYLMELWNAE